MAAPTGDEKIAQSIAPHLRHAWWQCFIQTHPHDDLLFVEDVDVDVVQRLAEEVPVDGQAVEQRHVLLGRRQRRGARQRLLAVDAAEHRERRDALLRQAARTTTDVADVGDVNRCRCRAATTQAASRWVRLPAAIG